MNCDRVFMVLTRGPFPTGDAEDHAVEEHLLDCASCRRLALALQPSIELFEEAASLDEKGDLPTYWGQLVSGTPSTGMENDSEEIDFARNMPRPKATRFARVDSPPRHSHHDQTDARSRWPLAGAFLIGIVFCLTTIEWLVNTSDSRANRPLNRAFQANDATWRSHPAMGFPTNAVGLVCPRIVQKRHQDDVQTGQAAAAKTPPVSNANSQESACCTKCHVAGDPSGLSDRALAKVVLACQGCHRE